MPISRRGFLGYAAGASAVGFAGAAGIGNLFAPAATRRSTCLLVDSAPGCTLNESAIGYAAALSSSNISWQRTSLQSLLAARTIILPGAVTMDADSAAKLKENLLNGSVILYESGAAFASPAEFSFHRQIISRLFGLGLHDPVRLWDSTHSLKQSPYVDFHWPVSTKVRDFSRIVPVDPANCELIAWFGDLPVAARRRIGKGTIVYMGSPLGPHMMSGDREAIRWLQAFCRNS